MAGVNDSSDRTKAYKKPVRAKLLPAYRGTGLPPPPVIPVFRICLCRALSKAIMQAGTKYGQPPTGEPDKPIARRYLKVTDSLCHAVGRSSATATWALLRSFGIVFSDCAKSAHSPCVGPRTVGARLETIHVKVRVGRTVDRDRLQGHTRPMSKPDSFSLGGQGLGDTFNCYIRTRGHRVMTTRPLFYNTDGAHRTFRKTSKASVYACWSLTIVPRRRPTPTDETEDWRVRISFFTQPVLRMETIP